MFYPKIAASTFRKKGCLEGIIKHLLVFLAPNIIFTGQLKKDIGLRFRVAQYLSLADQ